MRCPAKRLSQLGDWEERMSEAKPFIIAKYEVGEAWKQVKANHGKHGIDLESVEMFETELGSNLYKIWNRLSSGSYFPPPVRGVEIKKDNGKTRLLGIPTVADRVAQTVIRNYVEPQIEPHFHPDSYAYRANKSALDAIGITRQRCWKFNWVLEFDIKGAFDNIDHELMLKAVGHHVRCKWALRYIERWLKAPMVKEGELLERTKGTPQGGVISPLLFNLYMHYAFDQWMVRAYPNVPFARYADDGLLHCHSEEQARQLREALAARLQACGLELHPEKTKIVYCRDSNRKEDYPNTSFDFLGYTFRGRLAKSRLGIYFNSFGAALSTASKTHLQAEMRDWKLGRRTRLELKEIAEQVNPVLRGWHNYYGAFRESSLKLVMRTFTRYLIKWAVRKYRRFKRSKWRAEQWLKRIASRDPHLFYHWEIRLF